MAKINMPTGVKFWQGNVACAEGALAAGCNYFAGYPITPQSEIMERLSLRMHPAGGVFIQVEDELAAINSVIGAAWGGSKAMTATSGPGFSLMQEGIGAAVMTETPCVIVNVQRLGPSTGQATKCGQGDFMQARWGRHGDQTVIVLSPNSVQEMFELTIRSFNLSELFRVPVILLCDEIVAHMREKAVIPDLRQLRVESRKVMTRMDETPFGSPDPAGIPPMPRLGDGFNILVTTSTHDERGYRFTSDPLIHRKLVTRLSNKIFSSKEDIIDVEVQNSVDVDVGVVSYGITSRSTNMAIELASDKSFKIGHVRLKTLWPFPERVVRDLSERVKVIIVPEMSLGQLFYEVKRVSCGSCEVIPLNKIGGGEPITPTEILVLCEKMLGRV